MKGVVVEKEKACREKYWSEIDLDTKIKRLREEVKGLIRTVEFLCQQVSKLGDHRHSIKDESLYIPYFEPSKCEYERQQGKNLGDDVYF